MQPDWPQEVLHTIVIRGRQESHASNTLAELEPKNFIPFKPSRFAYSTPSLHNLPSHACTHWVSARCSWSCTAPRRRPIVQNYGRDKHASCPVSSIQNQAHQPQGCTKVAIHALWGFGTKYLYIEYFAKCLKYKHSDPPGNVM